MLFNTFQKHTPGLIPCNEVVSEHAPQHSARLGAAVEGRHGIFVNIRADIPILGGEFPWWGVQARGVHVGVDGGAQG